MDPVYSDRRIHEKPWPRKTPAADSSSQIEETIINIEAETIVTTMHSVAPTTKDLSGFPTLKPVIITKVHIGDMHDLGQESPSDHTD